MNIIARPHPNPTPPPCAQHTVHACSSGHERFYPHPTPPCMTNLHIVLRVSRDVHGLSEAAMAHKVRSDQMLILWDLSWAHRLWCLFEFAAFLKSKQSTSGWWKINICYVFFGLQMGDICPTRWNKPLQLMFANGQRHGFFSHCFKVTPVDVPFCQQVRIWSSDPPLSVACPSPPSLCSP